MQFIPYLREKPRIFTDKALEQLEVKMATQKTRNQDTYVGDRPNRNRTFAPQGQGGMGGGQGQGQGQGGYGGQMAGSSGGGGGMGNMGNMGGMGGGMNPMAAMAMGGMGGMGAMGGGAGGGGQQAFDPYAMSQFFKQVSSAFSSLVGRENRLTCRYSDGMGQLQPYDAYASWRHDERRRQSRGNDARNDGP
jgi:hypothetical protein